MDTRVCRTCDIAKPLTDYHQRNGKVSDKQTKCKTCFNEQRRIVDYAARWANKGHRSSPEWGNLTQVERDAIIKEFTDTVLVQYDNIDAYIADRKQGVSHNSFCGVDIPETEEGHELSQEEIESDEFMQILVKHERKKNPNKQVRREQLPFGYVYGVWHPADYWKGWVKVGRSGIMQERLSTYQTSDPWKNFKSLHKILVMDRYAGEKLTLDYFRSEGYEVQGEWVKVSHEVFIEVLEWMKDDQEFNTEEILDIFRTWKEQRAA